MEVLTYFCLRCASHTSIVHGHFLSTGTAGCIHLSRSCSTTLQSDRCNDMETTRSYRIGEQKQSADVFKVRWNKCTSVNRRLTPWGACNSSISLSKTRAVQPHPALVWPLPSLPHDIRRGCIVVVAAFSWKTRLKHCHESLNSKLIQDLKPRQWWRSRLELENDWVLWTIH